MTHLRKFAARAIVRLAGVLAPLSGRGRGSAHDDADLAQRVRLSGEW